MTGGETEEVGTRRVGPCGSHGIAARGKTLLSPHLSDVYFLGLLCVYIDTCNGLCALSCIEKWHTKMYIINIIMMLRTEKKWHSCFSLRFCGGFFQGLFRSGETGKVRETQLKPFPIIRKGI